MKFKVIMLVYYNSNDRIFEGFLENLDKYEQKMFPESNIEVKILQNETQFNFPLNYRNTISIFLGGINFKLDTVYFKNFQKIKNSKIPILVVKNDNIQFADAFPEFLSNINGFTMGDNWGHFFNRCFGMISIFKAKRKIFISYKRSESSAIASQLYRELSQRKFDVFLDEFNIDYGEDLRESIKHSIQDYGMVVLIESPSAFDSDWILFEYTTATSNKIPFFAIHWFESDVYKISQHTKNLSSYDLTEENFRNLGKVESQKQLKLEVINAIGLEIEELQISNIFFQIQNLYDSIAIDLEDILCEHDSTVENQFLKLNFKDETEIICFKICPHLPEFLDYYDFNQFVEENSDLNWNTSKKIMVYPRFPLNFEYLKKMEWLSAITSIICVDIQSLDGDFIVKK
jgi:hypothetical protein